MSILYKRLVGSHKKEADAILKVKQKILNGTLLALDPGSNSLGFSLWINGVLSKSGELRAKGSIGVRLDKLGQLLIEDVCYQPDVVVVEKVRTSTGHIYLTWAAGAGVAAVGAEHTIEVSTGAWRKNVTSSYVKGDEQDAIEIGKFAVTIAKEATKTRRAKQKKSRVGRNLKRNGRGRFSAA